MDRETSIEMRALADAMSAKLESLPTGQVITFPALHIPASNIHLATEAPRVEVQGAQVIVDMTPVADAIERITAEFATLTTKIIKLIEVVSNKPTPKIPTPVVQYTPPTDKGDEYDTIVPVNRDPVTGLPEYYQKQKRNSN